MRTCHFEVFGSFAAVSVECRLREFDALDKIVCDVIDPFDYIKFVYSRVGGGFEVI